MSDAKAEGTKLYCVSMSRAGICFSCAWGHALHVMALLLRTGQYGVGRPIILEALCVMHSRSLFLLEADNMVQ